MTTMARLVWRRSSHGSTRERRVGGSASAIVRLLGRRLILSIVLIVLVPSVVFMLEAATPGNVARNILGATAGQSAVHALSVSLGLTKPLMTRYVDWFGGLFSGDFGTSYESGRSVASLLSQTLPVTAIVVGLSLAVSVIVGIPLGIASARWKGIGSAFPNGLSVIGLALPNFVLAILLVEIFAVDLHLLPATGYTSASVSFTGWIKSIVLPVAALSAFLLTVVAKQTRDQMKAMLGKDFVRDLYARGLSTRSILFKHVLRNAMIPVVTVIGLNTAAAVGGAVFVEEVFGLPGIGAGLTNAVINHDVPVALGCAFWFTVMIVLANFLADIMYLVVDPRLRTAA